MIRPIKLIILLLFFILFSTYSPNYNSENKSIIFGLEKIKLEGLKILNEKDLEIKLKSLKGRSLFRIDQKMIQSKLKEFDFISSFTVKKIYPKTLKIKITEKKPIAIYIDKKYKFYVTINDNFINFVEIKEYKNLPTIFGKDIKLDNFFKKLEKINFPVEKIKSFHYFEIGRWDLILKNGRLIKLPTNDFIDKLENFMSISDNERFEKYELFDYRIKDQLILN